MDKKIRIYYDGTCNLCASAIGKVTGSDRKDAFEPIPVQENALPPNATIAEAMHDVHVVDSDGRLYKGSDAVFRILDEYPRWQWFAAIGRLPILKQLAEGGYWLVARTRYWIFGRKHV